MLYYGLHTYVHVSHVILLARLHVSHVILLARSHVVLLAKLIMVSCKEWVWQGTRG